MYSDYSFSPSSMPPGAHARKGASHKERPEQLAFGDAAYPPQGDYVLPPFIQPLPQDIPDFGPPNRLPLMMAPPPLPPQKQAGFVDQLFSLKGLLYSALLVAGATALGHRLGGKAAQAELKTLRQKVTTLGEAAASKASEKKAAKKVAEAATPAPKPTREIAIQTDAPVKPATKSQAVQTEKPVLREPDWTNMWHRYEDTQGQLSWQINRLHQRQGSLPKPLNLEAVDLFNTTRRYRISYDTAEPDKDLIGKVSEIALAADKGKAEMLKSKEAAELRMRIPAMEHFITHTRNTLQTFEAYQQQNGSGLRWLTQGLSRYDRGILKEIEQKLNAYEATVQNLGQSIQLPTK